MKKSELEFINNLRQISPYVSLHKGKTFVIYLPSQFIDLENPATAPLQQFIKDLILLNRLQIKTVIVCGAKQQLNTAFAKNNLDWKVSNGYRITEAKHLEVLQQTIGKIKSNIESTMTQASAEHENPVSIVSGNWVSAKPKGIIDGIDFHHTGCVRKIDYKSINAILESGQIALLTPLGYSLLGDVFNLNTQEQSFAVASLLQADKLIMFVEPDLLTNLPSELNPQSLQKIIDIETIESNQKQLLNGIVSTQPNIKRIHLIDQQYPSAILLELFSLDGRGTLISMDQCHHTRQANSDDIAGILRLVQPLEETGVLVKRSRELLALEIDNFYVVSRNNTVIGCVALYPITANQAELACLVISEDYQKQNIGRQLLKTIETKAKQQGIASLIVLTTQTSDWFIEHGFKAIEIQSLPKLKQNLYNFQRNSKALQKNIL
jgi:amino-acid N-acetyltransferase